MSRNRDKAAAVKLIYERISPVSMASHVFLGHIVVRGYKWMTIWMFVNVMICTIVVWPVPIGLFCLGKQWVCKSFL